MDLRVVICSEHRGKVKVSRVAELVKMRGGRLRMVKEGDEDDEEDLEETESESEVEEVAIEDVVEVEGDVEGDERSEYGRHYKYTGLLLDEEEVLGARCEWLRKDEVVGGLSTM